MCGRDITKMNKRELAANDVIANTWCTINIMNEYGFTNLKDVLDILGCDVYADGCIDYHADYPLMDTISKITSKFSFSGVSSPSTLSAAEYFANSDAYKEIKKVFALNHNMAVEQIPDYLTSQGLPEDAAIRTDSILTWFFNTTYETCKKKDVAIANLTNQLQMMTNNSIPDKPVTSLTIDAATHVAMLEKDMQILEARLKRANEALKAAGLEEV